VSDLEKFLRQAAERLKERLEEQQAGQQRQPRRQKPIRQVERAAPQIEEEILEAEISQPAQPPRVREKPPQKTQRIQRNKKDVASADQRMTERVNQVFDHAVGQLSQRPKSSLPQPTGFGSAGQTGLSSEVDRREVLTSPLIQMLRHSDSLKAAFIVGEIFKRKF
jgi:hypothetical protein